MGRIFGNIDKYSDLERDVLINKIEDIDKKLNKHIDNYGMYMKSIRDILVEISFILGINELFEFIDLLEYARLSKEEEFVSELKKLKKVRELSGRVDSWINMVSKELGG